MKYSRRKEKESRRNRKTRKTEKSQQSKNRSTKAPRKAPKYQSTKARKIKIKPRIVGGNTKDGNDHDDPGSAYLSNTATSMPRPSSPGSGSWASRAPAAPAASRNFREASSQVREKECAAAGANPIVDLVAILFW